MTDKPVMLHSGLCMAMFRVLIRLGQEDLDSRVLDKSISDEEASAYQKDLDKIKDSKEQIMKALLMDARPAQRRM